MRRANNQGYMTPFLKRLSLAVLIFALGLLALMGILSQTRGTPISAIHSIGRDGEPPAIGDSLFTRTIELYADVHIDPGLTAEPRLNGDGTYPGLWQDLSSAKQSITVQMYYSMPSAVADSLAFHLLERARAGVRVYLLFDAFGSEKLLGDYSDRLRAGGVRVAALRPLHWYTLHQASNRSHVRVVVVDGMTGWTGGFGLADYWLGDGVTNDAWRETNVRFQGPAVAQLQAAFIAAWAEATGDLLTGSLYFPRPVFTGTGLMQGGVLFMSPSLGSTDAERFLALSIAGARRSLYISNSYFVPDDDFRALLIAARKRGVDVRVLTAGPKTDIKTTYHAGRARYEELLRGGIRIYEYQPSMMHAKTLVADGEWSTIGSMNFDNRSLAFNNESNLAVLDTTFGAQMDSIFHADLRHSKEIVLEEFSKRSRFTRFLEFGSNLLSRLL